MIIETITNEVYMVGPGNFDLLTCLPPGTQKFRQLLDQMCVDGFVTGSEPLFITMPQELANLPLPRFWANNGLDQAEIGANSRLSSSFQAEETNV